MFCGQIPHQRRAVFRPLTVALQTAIVPWSKWCAVSFSLHTGGSRLEVEAELREVFEGRQKQIEMFQFRWSLTESGKEGQSEVVFWII